ncbi:MAG: signal peptide peptidase SppA [Litorimonas sp.]
MAPLPNSGAAGGTAAYADRKRLSGAKVFFITVLGVVVGLFLFFFLLFMFFASLASLAGMDTDTTEPVILEIDLRGGIQDAPSQPTLFSDSPASVVGMVRSLERAKTDDDVKGVFIRGESFGMAPASAEELRLALLDFRESGKFVITHAQGLGSTSIIPYHAISASDEIWLQGSATVATSGLYSQLEFFGGVFEFIDAQPQFFRHGVYKTAVNSYTESEATPEQREATLSLLTSIYDGTIENIAADREMNRDAVIALLDTAPHSAGDAVEGGLADKLGYFEEARDYAAELAGSEDAVFKSITDYAARIRYGKPVIALIEGEGTIMPGNAGGDGLFNPATGIGGESMAANLDSILEDDKVEAVVLRISSGGGSATASDQIMAAVQRVRDADIPVVVSMGQYAASGGYYIAAPADHIVAMPQTITGSIGIFGGKIAFEDTFARVGYNVEGIRVGGEFAGAYNADEPFTEAQAEGYAREMTRQYEIFLDVVADGRDMTREEVRTVGEGRVWTGEQALERGLVDELGGFDTALAAALKLAELDADAEVHIKRFPRPKTRDELFNDLLSGGAAMGGDLERLSALIQHPEVQAMLRLREELDASDDTMRARLPQLR